MKIRLRRNGPYVIEGDDVVVVDWNGVPYEADRLPIALCRCGRSARKPFCDGSHARSGFDGGEEAGSCGAAPDRAEGDQGGHDR